MQFDAQLLSVTAQILFCILFSLSCIYRQSLSAPLRLLFDIKEQFGKKHWTKANGKSMTTLGQLCIRSVRAQPHHLLPPSLLDTEKPGGTAPARYRSRVSRACVLRVRRGLGRSARPFVRPLQTSIELQTNSLTSQLIKIYRWVIDAKLSACFSILNKSVYIYAFDSLQVAGPCLCCPARWRCPAIVGPGSRLPSVNISSPLAQPQQR